MSEPYRRKRSFYQDVSGTQKVVAATDDTTLVTARNTSNTLYLQKLHVEVTAGSMGVTWTFKDSAGTPVLLVPSLDASAIVHYDFDFGPEGIPLTEGKNFLLDVSAAGATGWISWEMYQRLTSVVAAASA
jgi:hypothetical protein